MSIHIRDEDLEERVKSVGKARKHKTVARTARDLLLERLNQIGSVETGQRTLPSAVSTPSPKPE